MAGLPFASLADRWQGAYGRRNVTLIMEADNGERDVYENVVFSLERNGSICAIINRRPVPFDAQRVIDIQVGVSPSVAACPAGSKLPSTIEAPRMQRKTVTLASHPTAPIKFYPESIAHNRYWHSGHLFMVALHTRFGCKLRNADAPTQNESAVDSWKAAITAHLNELSRDHDEVAGRSDPQDSFLHGQMNQTIRLAGNELHALLVREVADANGALPDTWHRDKERWYNAFFLPYYALFFAVARATNTAAA